LKSTAVVTSNYTANYHNGKFSAELSKYRTTITSAEKQPVIDRSPYLVSESASKHFDKVETLFECQGYLYNCRPEYLLKDLGHINVMCTSPMLYASRWLDDFG